MFTGIPNIGRQQRAQSYVPSGGPQFTIKHAEYNNDGMLPKDVQTREEALFRAKFTQAIITSAVIPTGCPAPLAWNIIAQKTNEAASFVIHQSRISNENHDGMALRRLYEMVPKSGQSDADAEKDTMHNRQMLDGIMNETKQLVINQMTTSIAAMQMGYPLSPSQQYYFNR